MTKLKRMMTVGCLLTLMMPAWAQTKMEAETADYANCTVKEGSQYSGNKALELTQNNAKITFSYDVTEKGKYTIFVKGEGIGGEKVVALTVNGYKVDFKVNSLAEVEVGTFILTKGSNTIVVTPSWTWFRIDYIRLEKSQAPETPFDIVTAPVDQQATEGAKKMYAFLYQNFGKKTISGIMTGDMASGNGNVTEHDDVKAVYDASGKYPALIGFDFMNTTGKDAADSYNATYSEKTIALAKDTYRRGGLPAFTWHWRDPSRATSEFYTERCDMKISNAMNADGSWNKSSVLYQNMIKDIDAIADIFLDMQQEGMACLFRPLHEASGGWFWWGREGAANFKKLYWLIYDEMVNVKGVHNVIWVWNTGENDTQWNPGEAYYDVISVDIYNNDYDYASNYVAFDKLKTLSGGRKIIALAENGPIPDIDKEFDDDAVWSWWMPWYQTWNGKFIDKTSKEEWQKCMNDARTISLSDMPGWDSYAGMKPVQAKRQSEEGFYNLKGQRLKKKPSGGFFISGGIVFAN